ncbi:MAG TPA: hypothetical protein VN812_20215 [Candidatus Acidoferrales bacterium]|nr:hypothetical protein [Candidatus Acidoferrales bacterium]
MTERSVDAALRAYAAERKYHPTTIDRWLRLAPADRAALLELAQELRLGENQLRDLWEWAEEIAQRDGLSLATVLGAEALAAARRRAVGRSDKLKLVKAALRRLRFPQLGAAEDRLAVLVRELGLPPSVRVTPPESLEGDSIRIEIVADSAASLHDSVARLLAASQSPGCAAIFELLAGAR